MAGIITISPGHDPSYPWRQIGTAHEPGSSPRSPADYYLSPSEKGGEPPGRWSGAGLADLGFRAGEVIDREAFERLYGQFLDPRDPAGQARLGRSPQKFRSAEEIYAELAVLEPEATAERRAELLTEARCQVRAPVQYFDATFSVSKSITLLHASALANAARAADSGDKVAAEDWQRAANTVWAAIQAGNSAALEYLQREAGYTRSGYHGRQGEGISTGRWEDAHGFVVGSFAQHTSRDGDPQLHIHNLILNRVMRERDGAWRTLDSRALYQHRGAAAAIATLVAEAALSRDFGVGWRRRADGHGREVAGVAGELMDEFSSRRQSIGELTGRPAEEFRAQHGYAPDARALGKLRQWANHASRAPKDGEPLDPGTEVRRWAAQALASEAGALEAVFPGVAGRTWPGGTEPDSEPAPEPGGRLSAEQERDVMAEALARVQRAQPAWRKADLIRHLGEALPPSAACASDLAAAQLLPALADQVLAGGTGEEVVAIEAPEWPRAPEALRRADGSSIYRPHGAARFATLAQLTMEERLTAQARQPGAPRVEPVIAARLLGTDQAQLEAQLRDGAEPDDPVTGSGLSLSQAAAAYLTVTSDRRTEILVGPAGSGKTRTAGQIARLWREAGLGDVLGLTTSQAARNVLADAGVQLALNTAAFLQQLARAGPDCVRPGTLLLLDEASMMSMTDLAAIMHLAAKRGCRVLITGDHEQLAAVERGGGMLMLARQLGYVQLIEPVRFREDWERDATLRLRAGDISVLQVYDEHARLRGGDVEEAMESACRSWLADFFAGRDALLMARTEEQARELSRRARDYLRRYGIVTRGPELALRQGAIAAPGDLIMARDNDRRIPAGAPGRWLTNRDVLRFEGARGRSAVVRRLAGRDGRSGQPVWSASFEVPRTYLLSHCDLAYATTVHAAEGRTVDAGHLLVDGLGDRQGLYVGMSRGRYANYAHCVTGLRAADVAPGSRPAPELARARWLGQERAEMLRPDSRPAAGTAATRRHPVAVLAETMDRDGAVLSATEALRRELSDADHLGALSSIWYDLVRQAQAARYEQLLRQQLPVHAVEAALADPACTWLWRSLREAETTGLDAGDLLRSVIGDRSLRGARHVARVLDARIRRSIANSVPQTRGAWNQRVPLTGSAELDAYLAALADAMDDRVQRIGDHVARLQPEWAVCALGPLPDDPFQRAAWTGRAAQVGAYREMYGYTSPEDAIGSEPGRGSPEARADWHTALAAIGGATNANMHGCSDDLLHQQRAAYQRETSWAPPYVADDLRSARMQARTAYENLTHETYERERAQDASSAAHHDQAIAGLEKASRQAINAATELEQAQETRRQWEAITASTRQRSLEADQELRRRHPGQYLEPLRPVGRDDTDLAVTSDDQPAGHPGAAAKDTVTPLNLDELSMRVALISDRVRKAGEVIDTLAQMHTPGEESGMADLGPAWTMATGRRNRTLVQPAHLDVVPASEVLRRASERRSAARLADSSPEAESA